VKAKPVAVQKSSSVRLTPTQYDKLHQLSVATNSSINKWAQKWVQNGIDDEWQARMDAAAKLDKALRS